MSPLCKKAFNIRKPFDEKVLSYKTVSKLKRFGAHKNFSMKTFSMENGKDFLDWKLLVY